MCTGCIPIYEPPCTCPCCRRIPIRRYRPWYGSNDQTGDYQYPNVVITNC